MRPQEKNLILALGPEGSSLGLFKNGPNNIANIDSLRKLPSILLYKLMYNQPLNVLLVLLTMPFCLPKYDVVSRDQNNNNVATSPIAMIILMLDIS